MKFIIRNSSIAEISTKVKKAKYHWWRYSSMFRIYSLCVSSMMLFALLFSNGCKQKSISSAAGEASISNLLSVAGELTSDLSSWVADSRELKQFLDAAMELGWLNYPEVQAFKKAAQDEIAFSMSIMNVTSDGERVGTKDSRWAFSGNAELAGHAPGVSAEGALDLNANYKSRKVDHERGRSVIIGQLNEEQVKHFSEIHNNLLNAYCNLVQFSKRQAAQTAIINTTDTLAVATSFLESKRALGQSTDTKTSKWFSSWASFGHCWQSTNHLEKSSRNFHEQNSLTNTSLLSAQRKDSNVRQESKDNQGTSEAGHIITKNPVTQSGKKWWELWK